LPLGAGVFDHAGFAEGEYGVAEIARELCHRVYTLCERKKRASEALAYNGWC
jgi:hypothetical protein